MSLGTLFLAAQFLDLLWPALLQAGWERVAIAPAESGPTPLIFESFPISHSLAAVCAWGFLFAAIHAAIHRNLRAAIVLGLCVASHWALDLLVHGPDLPVAPGGSTRLGLGLWTHPVMAQALELAVFGVGIALYVRTTRAADRIGAYGFWSLAGLLVAIHLGNTFGPPPPSASAVAWVGHLQWLFVFWAFWIDRHRSARVVRR